MEPKTKKCSECEKRVKLEDMKLIPCFLMDISNGKQKLVGYEYVCNNCVEEHEKENEE